MATAEQILDTAILDLIVPNVEVELPKKLLAPSEADPWLATLKGLARRKQAFFDERLDCLFTIRLANPVEGPVNSTSPPGLLLAFLNHLHISLEAIYISPPRPEFSDVSHLVKTPARTSSTGRMKPQIGETAAIPQVSTPKRWNAENQKTFTPVEGTLLQSSLWGEDISDESNSFALLYSMQDGVWVAIYRLSINVLFVRTNVPDPQLSLTVTSTLRDKPLVATLQRRFLTDLIFAAESLPPLSGIVSSANLNVAQTDSHAEDTTEITGLEEVNLLDGLSAGAPTAGGKKLYFPSTRLGPSTRRESYGLPPISPTTPSAATPTSARPIPILAKSFRRVLNTASGLRVRLRTVFIPYIFTPRPSSDGDRRHEVGHEERTVILSVEVENSGESNAGFVVEHVYISISGEGAKVDLIGWGEPGFADPTKLFPLLVHSTEQYNLLYAVTFLGPADAQGIQPPKISTEPDQIVVDFHRSVSINITGKPFEGEDRYEKPEGFSRLSYPTSSFLSRWNCVLDFSPSQNGDPVELNGSPTSVRDVLPAPASPFPPSGSQAIVQEDKTLAMRHPLPSAFVDRKRHTFAAMTPVSQGNESRPSNYRASTPVINTSNVSGTPDRGRFTPVLPTVIGRWRSRTPTTAEPLSPPLPALPSIEHSPLHPPPTPAYPSYANAPVTPGPTSQRPIFGQTGVAGPSIEISRERMSQFGLPQTPGPRLAAPFGGRLTGSNAEMPDPIVVSIALLQDPEPTPDFKTSKIYPLDEFSLEIFVFNQSSDVRRFEVSYPGRRRRRVENEYLSSPAYDTIARKTSPGYVPLESRIRIGPLRPSTCQSIRMRFMALTPGVHSIDTLTLSDVESGFSINLRSIMDVVVHDNSRTITNS